jgi:hypothetical protein
LRPVVQAKARPNKASKVEVITGGNTFSVKF